MLSNRLILIFLGVIFVIIIVLSSQKLSAGIKSRFGGLLPATRPVPTLAVPLPQAAAQKLNPTPTLARFGNTNNKTVSSSVAQIPSTGPADLSLGVIASFAGFGLILRKLSLR